MRFSAHAVPQNLTTGRSRRAESSFGIAVGDAAIKQLHVLLYIRSDIKNDRVLGRVGPRHIQGG